MNNPSCELCQSMMTKAETVKSGNATYITYICKNCNTEKTICIGIGK